MSEKKIFSNNALRASRNQDPEDQESQLNDEVDGKASKWSGSYGVSLAEMSGIFLR